MKKNFTISSLEQLKNDGKEILFIAVNRETATNSTNVKGKVKSLKEYGVCSPLILLPAKYAADENLTLLDSMGTTITEEQRIANSYVILDGNNRYKAYLAIAEEKKNKEAKGEIPEIGKGLDDIPCIIQQEQPSNGVLKTLIEMNTTAISWKGGDYIRTAAKLNPDNEAMKWANEMTKAKMSLSTISLFLTFDNKLKPTEVAKLIKTGEMGCACNVERAKRIYNALTEAGFSQKDINKRYLISFIRAQGEDMGIALDAFKMLSEEEVKYISENLKDFGNPFVAVEAKMQDLKAQRA